eukprot:jgi/Mesen1/11050/ME000099S10489
MEVEGVDKGLEGNGEAQLVEALPLSGQAHADSVGNGTTTGLNVSKVEGLASNLSAGEPEGVDVLVQPEVGTEAAFKSAGAGEFEGKGGKNVESFKDGQGQGEKEAGGEGLASVEKKKIEDDRSAGAEEGETKEDKIVAPAEANAGSSALEPTPSKPSIEYMDTSAVKAEKMPPHVAEQQPATSTLEQQAATSSVLSAPSVLDPDQQQQQDEQQGQRQLLNGNPLQAEEQGGEQKEQTGKEGAPLPSQQQQQQQLELALVPIQEQNQEKEVAEDKEDAKAGPESSLRQQLASSQEEVARLSRENEQLRMSYAQLTSDYYAVQMRMAMHNQYAPPVSAFLEVHDIAGLVRGANEGQGLGNAFLSHIRAVDGIFHVCRAFDDSDVIHVEDTVDPIRDLEIIHNELRLKVKEWLQDGKDVRLGEWKALEAEVLNQFQLLTAKPVVYLVNLTEKDYQRKKNKWLAKIHAWVQEHGADPIIPFSGVLESALADMPEDEVKKYCEEKQLISALPKIVKTGFAAINLIYFFTSGPDEVRCWQIRKNLKAPQAAGAIHTDFERGFICAEVMKFEDLKELGTEVAVKAAGKYRQEGKTYVVQDGDIIFFKFNVTSSGKK